MSDEDADAILDLDFEFDPEITQRILAAIDRSEDPHLHIDILRRAVYKQAVKIQQMGRALKTLQDAERDRLTRTGVWTIVKGKLDERAVGWVQWAIRGTLAVAGTAIIGTLLKLAWKGLTK
jgi:hypothetical protein